MSSEAIYYTAQQLAEMGKEEIPSELISNTHLIYSSPATLAFNSPGAEGFGVKRAALAVPESVMLLVAPGCCGRNTSTISSMRAYHHRYFYLMMDETDLVTGRHLKVIPDAVQEVVDSLEKKPAVVMICITCVDALLGTDMERVCRRAEEKTGVRVKPCYMYALTREGRKPPMVHVRQSIYSMLEQRSRRSSSVNIMGFFAPLDDGTELYAMLKSAGVRNIREIGRCKTYEEFQMMAEANFNLVLNPEARFAAEDLQYKLGIPSVELIRMYQTDRIHRQYEAFGQALGVTFDDAPYRQEAEAAVAEFQEQYPDTVFAVGEAMNGNPFALRRKSIPIWNRQCCITAAAPPMPILPSAKMPVIIIRDAPTYSGTAMCSPSDMRRSGICSGHCFRQNRERRRPNERTSQISHSLRTGPVRRGVRAL